MKERILYALAEPGYTSSVWFHNGYSGLNAAAAKHKRIVRTLEEAHAVFEIPDLKTLVLIASDSEWTGYLLSQLRGTCVKVVLMGSAPHDFGPHVSGTIIDREALVRDMVRYFCASGRTRIASLGYEANLVNDNIRRHAFLSAAQQHGLPLDEAGDVYDVINGLADCLNRFFDRVSRYDSVLCTNDYIATMVLSEAKRRGVRVPEDLFVAGSGNLLIGSCTQPTLTTSTLDYFELGVQTFSLWNLLESNENIVSASVTIPYRIIPRASTAFAPLPGEQVSAPAPQAPKAAFCDPLLLQMRQLENCLMQCDALDRALIAGVLREQSTEELATSLFISVGTVQYRLKKLYSVMGAATRAEFAQMLRLHIAFLDGCEPLPER